MRILHLHVRKEYWEAARFGDKVEEFRAVKPYWNKRLEREYDLIYYWLGYTKQKLVFGWDGFAVKRLQHKEFGESPAEVYAISLRKPVVGIGDYGKENR